MAVDGRPRIQPPVHPEALGSFLTFLQVTMPLRQIVGTDSLAEMALLLRRAIQDADENFQGAFTNDVISLINNLPDVGVLTPSAFLDCPGLHCSQTSWEKFRLYDLQWGPLLGNRIQAIRSPSTGILNGMQIMFPYMPDGGREVLVGIGENCLQSLIDDLLWSKYAETR